MDPLEMLGTSAIWMVGAPKKFAKADIGWYGGMNRLFEEHFPTIGPMVLLVFKNMECGGGLLNRRLIYRS